MANQESPSVEDLEPEGEDFGMRDEYMDPQAFDDEDLSAFPDDSLGEYAFEDFESEYLDELDELEGDFEGDEFAEEWDLRPRQSATLPEMAASTALEWSGRAGGAPLPKGNGHRPATPKRSRSPGWLPGEERLAGLEPDVLDGAASRRDKTAWAAGLQEDDELMHVLATAAAGAPSSMEAEGLAAAMAPLSLRLLPHAYRRLWPALPGLVRGTVGLTRLLHRRPATRHLIRMLPAVLKNSATQLARYTQTGRPVTRQVVSKVLTRQAALILHQAGGVRSPLGRVRHSGRGHA